MKTKFKGILTLVIAFTVHFAFAQKTVTGTVSDETGALPGVNVLIKGTQTGTETDFDGKYSIDANQGDVLLFSYVGYDDVFKTVGNGNSYNVVMTGGVALEEVVVTALGIKREQKTLAYATQQVKQKELNITQDVNIKTAIAGKVAGVQIKGQAGSKLGDAGKIRIRGAISMTTDNDPLYILDGVPVDDPNDIDMDNIASVDVLKGPSATALYGQRADSGVVVLMSIKGSKNLAVEIGSSIVLDKIAYLPNYQNEYGQGYDGESSFTTFDFAGGTGAAGYDPSWVAMDGLTHLNWTNNLADESWGAKFDGRAYVPWYAWWPESPYFGKTTKWEAKPNNIKDFYNTGVAIKNSVSISGGGSKYNARLSYSNLNIDGVTPYTDLKKHYINTSFQFDATDKLTINTNINLALSKIHGEFDDDYGNQTTGSFNGWFGRQIDTNIMRELKDLKTPDGYSASWNWWGPQIYGFGGTNNAYRKPAFWFNPYMWQENFDQRQNKNNLTGSLTALYEFSKNWSADVSFSRAQNRSDQRYEMNSFIGSSAAPEKYNDWVNGFGVYGSTRSENNMSSKISYKEKFNDFDISAFVGGNLRRNNYGRESTQMNVKAKTGGLIIPDVYVFSNAAEQPVTGTYYYNKKVNSLYGKVSFGYKNMAYVDATYRQDWSSALPSGKNGYGYPSVGTTFLFSELLENKDFLTFGKLRASWGQVGNDVAALRINPTYPLGDKPLGGSGTQLLMYNPGTLIDPNLKPALNTAFEVGFDLKLLKRIGLGFTYYDEKRTDEIIPISISAGTGYGYFLTNAGESQRKGIEVTLNADIFKSDSNGFAWNTMFNYGQNKTIINTLPGDMKTMEAPGMSSGGTTPMSSSANRPAFGFVAMEHKLGEEWGQLRGTGFAFDDKGNHILDPTTGLYAIETNKYFGSVLPDFTGGFVNSFSYKGLSLVASVDFQQGGQFFSLSEMWGTYSGLFKETAGLNDKGKPKRDAVADGGGIHVVGVDETGETVDMYAEAHDYFTQWYGNRLAEPFIHDASYIKLRELGLSYQLPQKWVGKIFKGATIGVVSRNVWLIAVAKDNKHKWDPSELAQTYGENSQVPGTRSYGVNVKLKF